MKHLILFGCLSLAGLAVTAPPGVPTPPSSVITTYNGYQLERNSVENYFRFDISFDGINWTTVCHSSQPAVLAGSTPVVRIKDELPGSDRRFYRFIPESKADFDNAPASDGVYGTGILIFRR